MGIICEHVMQPHDSVYGWSDEEDDEPLEVTNKISQMIEFERWTTQNDVSSAKFEREWNLSHLIYKGAIDT